MSSQQAHICERREVYSIRVNCRNEISDHFEVRNDFGTPIHRSAGLLHHDFTPNQAHRESRRKLKTQFGIEDTIVEVFDEARGHGLR